MSMWLLYSVQNATNVVFLLYFQILGCGVLGVGIWLLVKEFSTREMSAIMGSRLIEMITYGLIAGGGAATILAFCGCCGTMRQERCVLGFVSIADNHLYSMGTSILRLG